MSGARAHHAFCPCMQFVSQLTITNGRRGSAHVSGGAGSLYFYRNLALVIQPQAKLDGARLVALSANGSKTRRTEETVGIAEVGAVEDVAQLSLESQIESFLYRKDLEYVDVLVVGGECTDRAIT